MVKYLVKKQHNYWFRRKVGKFGEIVFSLKTKNYEIAVIRHSYIDYKIKKLLHKGIFEIMTVDEIRKIIDKYKTYMINEEYNDFEDTRDRELTISIDGKKYGGHTYQALEQEIKRYESIHEQNDIELIKQETTKILNRSNIKEDFSKFKSEKDINIFHWELFKTEWELLNKSFQEQEKIVQTTKNENEKENQKLQEILETLLMKNRSSENIHSSQSIKISELFVKYLKEKRYSNDWSEKNVRDLEYVIGYLYSWFEDKSIKDLTRENFSSFRDDVLVYLPVKSTKKILENKSVKEIIEIVKREKLKTISKVTINKHLRRVHQVFEWASINGFIDKNLTKDLAFQESKKGQKQKTAKLPYTDEELKLLFEKSPWFTEDINITLKYNPQNIFIPLLCLFTGAKPTELALLQVSDIKTKDEVTGIEFNDHVKNHYNLRFTPISKVLIDIGFIKFVNYQKKSKHKKLFPTATIYKSGGTNFTNDYTKYNRKYISADKDKSFYSLRHLVNQKLKNKQTPIYIINDIMGHSKGYSNKDISVYGDKEMPSKIIKDTIDDCLVYDFLNFSVLKEVIKKKYT